MKTSTKMIRFCRKTIYVNFTNPSISYGTLDINHVNLIYFWIQVSTRDIKILVYGSYLTNIVLRVDKNQLFELLKLARFNCLAFLPKSESVSDSRIENCCIR